LQFNIANYECTSSNTVESFKRISELCCFIEKLNTKRTLYYFILGNELANVKFAYFRKFCDTHSSDDIYVILDCKLCINQNKSNTSKFYGTIIEKTGYSKTHISLLINIAKMCNKYPKLMFTTIPLDKLKNYKKLILDKMKEDDFWKVDDGFIDDE
jgi:hypothetical protein